MSSVSGLRHHKTGQIGLLSNQLQNIGNYSAGNILSCLICKILIRFRKLSIKDESSLENI